MFSVDYIEEIPNVDDYLQLRELNGWGSYPKNQASKGLQNSLLCICAKHKHEMIGFGRVVGDGYTYFYLQDILIHPEHQNKGIGSIILNILMNSLSERFSTEGGSFIGLMTSPSLINFYGKIGFEIYPEDIIGMRLSNSIK